MIDKSLSNPTLLIATIAVFMSILSIIIGGLSLKIQRTHNRKTVKPIGNIILSDYENLLAVNIKNTGVGPLIIKSLKVNSASGGSKNNLIDWMPKHPEDLPWTSFLANATDFVISPGQSLNIIELKTNTIISNTFSDFRDEVRKVLSGITIELTYKDIYDKKQPTNKRELEWFGRNVK